MATEKKFLKLDDEILLEYVYNDSNFKQDNYKILHNYNTGIRSYMSGNGLNIMENSLYPIDKVIMKYAKIDTNKNFLKIENYSSELIKFDTVRLHMPTNFSFYDNSYKGLYVRIYTFDYYNKKQIDFANYMYDDTSTASYSAMTLNKDFLFNGIMYGKYITFDIPSINAVSESRYNNSPIENSINYNITKENGLSQTSPIFIEFSYISAISTKLGETTYRLSTASRISLNKAPEYQDVGVSINEASDGDYFEIYGSYDNDNQEFDNYIDNMISKGKSLRLEYHVSLYEENILINTNIFSITENYTQKVLYRPIITFSNTTALIDVELRIIDNVDGSIISRQASIGLTRNIFKYGKKLMRINMDNAYKPKIYNLKSLNRLETGAAIIPMQQDVNITKVNYPVIADRVKILVYNNTQNVGDYKPFGLAEIILNPFDNFIKFVIGEETDSNVSPYNLTKLMENSTMLLVFKNDSVSLEIGIYQESGDNNYENGVVIFKINESDISAIKQISASNKDWHLVIKSWNNNTKTLLYSGKFVTYDKVIFTDTKTYTNPITSNNINNSTANLGDFIDNVPSSVQNSVSATATASSGTNTDTNMNAMVFLNLNADITKFEEYLTRISANIYIKRAGGNDISGSYFYFILNVSKAIAEDIKIQSGVKEVVLLPFDIGKNSNATTGQSVADISSSLANFNCAVADRLNS